MDEFDEVSRAEHCATLGLPEDASTAEITRKYRQLSKVGTISDEEDRPIRPSVVCMMQVNHPDKGGDPEVQKRFDIAYGALTKTKVRADVGVHCNCRPVAMHPPCFPLLSIVACRR